MAAYAALLSVMHIIDNLQNHPRPPITIHKAQTQSLTQKIAFLQDFLESFHFHGGNEELESLQSHIMDAAHAAEDVIESHIVDQIYVHDGEETSGFERLNKISSCYFYIRLQKLIEDMDLMEREVKEMRNKVGLEDRLRITVKATVVSSKSPCKGQNIMVGFDDVLYQILDKLKGQGSNRQIIPIVGMGGIGKTTLARNVYESKLVEEHFDMSSWVTISQEYNVQDVISEILSLENKKDRATSRGTREEDLGLQLHKNLWARRYLIIVDDMWSSDVWNKLKKFFPENDCGSRIIVTTRLSNLALELSGTRGLQMSFLDESSWTLLIKTVFGEEGCPHDGLEEIGKKIAGNCKGLPLSIVVIGGLLAKHSSEPVYWEYVAGNLNSFVNLVDDERCYKTLRTSYDLLPPHLKPCFLYMGIYPEDHEISVSELIKLWVAEGFLKPINGKSLEVAAQEYLTDLIYRNLVLVHKSGISSGKVKSYTIHDLLRDLCKKQARKEKFLCITTQNGLISGGITTQRRFAIHERISKKVFQFPSLAKSFIFDFLGVLPSLNSNSRLLRILKVANRCLYSEQRERYLDSVFDDYVNSRYLAITGPRHSEKNISFPSSVYHLWNLQTLIVEGFGGCIAAALKHVKFDKFYLPDPPGEGDHFVLWNLQTLSTVYNFKFGEGVAKRIKRIFNIQKLKLCLAKRILNIQKLKLCYEDFEWGFKVASHYFLKNLGSLEKLQSLGCMFLRNRPSRSDLLQNLTFPHSLRKLSLRGIWLNWDDMSTTVGHLPLLEVLKLEWHSFTGPRWETIEGQFCNLRFLLIDSSYDLKHWITESTHFPRLEHLVLRHVECLEEIPLCIEEISTLQSMKVECCSDGAVISAKAIQEAQEECGNESFKVQVISLLEEQYEEIKGLATPNFQFEFLAPGYYKQKKVFS